METILRDSISLKYPQFYKHLRRSYLGRKEMWAYFTRYEERLLCHGIVRGPCAHKNAVAKHFNIAEFLVIPSLDNKARGMYHYLAPGSVLADSWYRSLDQPDQILNVQDYVEERTQQQHQP